MCSHKAFRERVGSRAWLAGTAAAASVIALLHAGCAPDYVTSNTAAVNLYMAAINGGSVLDSDVRNGETSSFICPDMVDVDLAVRNKNPLVPSPIIPSHVILKSYEVRYSRTDGRGVEGLDVPYRVTGSMTGEIDVATGGTSAFAIEVVRRQAKMEPPLSMIHQTAVLSVMAQITIYGETIAGDPVSATGGMQIDFADYGDKLTACPTK